MDKSKTNAFTVDVEDYFQVAAFDQYIERSTWESRECRVEGNVERILSLLSKHDAKATFFTLGWIAERFPNMVRKIVLEGHEIASHGYGHQKATLQTPDEVRADLLRAKGILQDITGQAIVGYRAPSFSIGKDNLWVHQILAETGHEYSSSVYPVHHDHYGMPEANRFACEAQGGILEIPLTTIQLLSRNIPAAGGGYFRLFPYSLSRWMIDRVNQKDGQAAIFYCHPWEIDPEQPKIKQASTKSRFRHYVNMHRMENRLDQLLQDFKWDRVDNVFADKLPNKTALTVNSTSMVYES